MIQMLTGETLATERSDVFRWRPSQEDIIEAYRLERLESLDAEIVRRESQGVDMRDARAMRDRLAQATQQTILERVPTLASEHEKDWHTRCETWRHVCLGQRYLRCSIDNFAVTSESQKKVVQQVRAFASQLPDHLSSGRNLVIAGPAGSGKDHFMAYLLRLVVLSVEAVGRGPEGLVNWTTGVDITRGRQRCILPRYLLAVSDPVLPGHELRWSSLTNAYEVVDRQYRDRRPVWVTINAASREHMESMLTAPIADRLLHDAEVVLTDWATYRRPINQTAH